jgi:hypothetical protein
MESRVDGYAVSGGTHTSTVIVEIDEATLKALEEIPDAKPGKRAIFTPEQDTILLRFWKQKNKDELSRFLGFAVQTCRARYRELLRMQGKEE